MNGEALRKPTEVENWKAPANTNGDQYGVDRFFEEPHTPLPESKRVGQITTAVIDDFYHARQPKPSSTPKIQPQATDNPINLTQKAKGVKGLFGKIRSIFGIKTAEEKAMELEKNIQATAQKTMEAPKIVTRDTTPQNIDFTNQDEEFFQRGEAISRKAERMLEKNAETTVPQKPLLTRIKEMTTPEDFKNTPEERTKLQIEGRAERKKIEAELKTKDRIQARKEQKQKIEAVNDLSKKTSTYFTPASEFTDIEEGFFRRGDEMSKEAEETEAFVEKKGDGIDTATTDKIELQTPIIHPKEKEIDAGIPNGRDEEAMRHLETREEKVLRQMDEYDAYIKKIIDGLQLQPKDSIIAYRNKFIRAIDLGNITQKNITSVFRRSTDNMLPKLQKEAAVLISKKLIDNGKDAWVTNLLLNHPDRKEVEDVITQYKKSLHK